MDWKKELFPQLEYNTYINHASLSPLNSRAAKAMNELMNRFSAVGLAAWKDGAACRRRLRGKIGEMTGCDWLHLGLTQNTSHGIVIVAREYPWREGDCLVLFRGEFPGNATPWLAVARREKLKVLWLNPEDLAEETQAFHEVMAQKPRLMAISWVQYQTGYSTPLSLLSALRDKYKVHICVDVIQGLGPLTMNLEETPLDFVVCGGHKWLLSPEGTGFIYIHPQRMVEMEPALASWLSLEDPVSFLTRGGGLVDYDKPIRKDALRYEMGTMNNVGYAGMEASIDIFLEVGPEDVSKQVLKLADECRSGLQSLGIKTTSVGSGSGNVSFALNAASLQNAARHLDEKGICVSTPDGHLRASPHFYNDSGDIERYLAEIHLLQLSGMLEG